MNSDSPKKPDNEDSMPALSAAHDLETIAARETGNSKIDNLRSPENMEIGPYEIVRKIGEGGMGAVYEARQVEPVRRSVALKVISKNLIAKASDAEQVIARFEAERQALSMMSHTNIAKVLDVGTTAEGAPFFAMELVDGIPISEYCDAKKLSIEERLELFIPVCHAVQHAHQKGIIHRDLKPNNVLVEKVEGVAVPKVIDFGLAKATERQSRLTDKTLTTQFGQVLGTLQYMSPEQAGITPFDVDTRSDVYSLGVILYELLTGTTPIDRETLQNFALVKVLEVIRDKEPVCPSIRLSSSNDLASSVSALRQIQPGKLQHVLKGDLDWIVMKSLDKERKQRYQTAAEFAADVNRFLTDDAVIARPKSTWYRCRKFVRRNRGFVASVASIGLLLALSTIGFAWLANERDVARLDEAKQKNEAIDQKNRADRQSNRANDNAAKSRENEIRAIAAEKSAKKSDARTKLSFASSHWQNDRVDEANRLLDLIPSEFRSSLEWKLLNRLFKGSDLTLYQKVPFSCIAISPDGKTIATGSDVGESSIVLWDAFVGKKVKTIQLSDNPCTNLSFDNEGKFLISCHSDMTCKIWDVASVTVIRSFAFAEKKNRVSSIGKILSGIVIGNNNQWIALPDDTKAIQLWDWTTGKSIAKFEDKKDVNSFAFHPNGQLVALANSDGKVRIWDIQTQHLIKTFNAHSQPFRDLCFSPDGNLIVTASYDTTIKVWSVESILNLEKPEEARALQVLAGHTGRINSIACSPDGATIISAADDTTMRVWDLQTGQMVHKFIGHQGNVKQVVISNDGTKAVSISDDNTSKIWDLKSHSQAIEYRNTAFDFNSLAFSPDGTKIATNDAFKVKILDLKSHQIISVLDDHVGGRSTIAFHPNGNNIVTACRENLVKIWDIDNGQPIRTLKGHQGDVLCVAYAPDGRRVASSSRDGTIKIWDAASGHVERTIVFPKNEYRNSQAEAIAFHPGGKWVASASLGVLQVWNLETGEEVATLNGSFVPYDQQRISFTFNCVTFNKNGNLIAAASPGNSSGDKIALWDWQKNQLVNVLESGSQTIECLTFAENDSRLISGGNGNLKIWDLEVGEELVTIKQPAGSVTGLAVSPDKQSLAMTVRNRLQIWPLTERTPFIDLDIQAPFFSPDGKVLANFDSDDTIRLVNLESMKQTTIAPGKQEMYAEFSPDGKCLLVESEEGVEIWDVISGRKTFTATGQPDVGVEWHEDQPLAIKYWLKKDLVEIWNYRTGKLITRLSAPELADFEVSANGKRALTQGADNSLVIWELPSAKRIHEIQVDEPLRFTQFSPDAKQLLLLFEDMRIEIREIATNKLHLSVDNIYPQLNFCFSPDGSSFAVLNKNRTISFWDLSDASQPRAITNGKIEVMTNPRIENEPENALQIGSCAMRFSEDGSKLFATGDIAKKHIWNATNGKSLAPNAWEPGPQIWRDSPAEPWTVVYRRNKALLFNKKNLESDEAIAFRLAKYRPSPRWRESQRAQAERNRLPWTETIHAAWLLKMYPDSTDAAFKFEAAFERLEKSYEKNKNDLTPTFPPLIAEMRKRQQYLSNQLGRQIKLIHLWKKAIWRFGLADLLMNRKLGNSLKVSDQQKTEIIAIAKKLLAEINSHNAQSTEFAKEKIAKHLQVDQQLKLEEIIKGTGLNFNLNNSSSTLLLEQFTRHWDANRRRDALGSPFEYDAKQNVEDKLVGMQLPTTSLFADLLEGEMPTKTLVLTERQLGQIRSSMSIYKNELAKISKEQKQLNDKDISVFNEKVANVETEFLNRILLETLDSAQVEKLKWLFYQHQLGSRGLLPSLLDSHSLSIGEYLKLSSTQRLKLSETKEVVQRIIEAQSVIRRQSVDAFIELLNQKQQTELNKILGKKPDIRSFPTVESIRAQLKKSVGETSKSNDDKE